MAPEITYKQLHKLMQQRRRSVDDLVDLFRGRLDDNRGFWERVFSGKYQDTVVPYRSVVQFHEQEAHYAQDSRK